MITDDRMEKVAGTLMYLCDLQRTRNLACFKPADTLLEMHDRIRDEADALHVQELHAIHARETNAAANLSESIEKLYRASGVLLKYGPRLGQVYEPLIERDHLAGSLKAWNPVFTPLIVMLIAAIVYRKQRQRAGKPSLDTP